MNSKMQTTAKCFSGQSGLTCRLAEYTLAAKMAEKPGVKCYDVGTTYALDMLPMHSAAMPVR